MRAAVVDTFGPPQNILVHSDVPLPTINNPKQVLIDVHYAGVNPVDTYIRSGVYAKLPSLPYTPGRDGAGVVREAGTQSTIKVGHRVWFYASDTGASAEVASSARVFTLPQTLSFEEGACLGVPYLTAIRVLYTKGAIKKSDRVLIHGASGGVGLAACQLAKHAGVELIVGTASSERGAELVKSNGADHVVNHRNPDYVNELKKLAPEGFTLIVEMLANVNLPSDLSLLSSGGRVGIVGNRGECTINPRALMMNETSVFGVTLGAATDEELNKSIEILDRLFTETPYRPVINKIYPLDGLPEAHTDVIQQAGGAAGNLVIKIR